MAPLALISCVHIVDTDIEKLLDTLCAEDFANFVELLQPAVSQAKRTGCGKQMLSIEKKIHRLPTRWNSGLATNGFGHVNNPPQLSPPPFAIQYGPAATTPSPVPTADTQSLQSSAIRSTNSEAAEGRNRCREDSDPIL